MADTDEGRAIVRLRLKDRAWILRIEQPAP
jgi:hypothetical protein